MKNLVKYPRTYHLPWSSGISDDDKVLKDVTHFTGKVIVMSEKMDGENTTMSKNYIHARSVDSIHHPSRDWVKRFWSTIRMHIPEGFRICGENMYAKHSIFYENLCSYFLGFSVWENDKCLSWAETLEWFELLGISSVPVLYVGIYDEERIKSIWEKNNKDKEGYVIRIADSFNYNEFKESVAKYVRKDHISTDDHWMYRTIVPNKLGKLRRKRMPIIEIDQRYVRGKVLSKQVRKNLC